MITLTVAEIEVGARCMLMLRILRSLSKTTMRFM